jgi:hypothetical protein
MQTDEEDVSDENKKWASEVRVQLDQDDTLVLDALVGVEKLPRTDILRRALRAYAREHKIATHQNAPAA